MLIQELQQINSWWQKSYDSNLIIIRDTYINNLLQDRPWIEILIGARRVGKTSLLKLIVERKISLGENPKTILYLSAEFPRIQQYLLDDMLATYRECMSFDSAHPITVIIDEVQELPDWRSYQISL